MIYMRAMRDAQHMLQKCDEMIAGYARELEALQGGAEPGAASEYPDMASILKRIFELFVSGTRSVEEFKGQLVSILTASPLITMQHSDTLRELFSQLTDELLERSTDALNSVQLQTPYAPAFIRHRAAAITYHYMQLRGLRAHIREDMATFVDLFNRTNSIKQVSAKQSDCARFFEDYHAISCGKDANHTAETQILLAEAGSEIMRRMLLMGAHLLDLLRLWDGVEKTRQQAL